MSVPDWTRAKVLIIWTSLWHYFIGSQVSFRPSNHINQQVSHAVFFTCAVTQAARPNLGANNQVIVVTWRDSLLSLFHLIPSGPYRLHHTSSCRPHIHFSHKCHIRRGLKPHRGYGDFSGVVNDNGGLTGITFNDQMVTHFPLYQRIPQDHVFYFVSIGTALVVSFDRCLYYTCESYDMIAGILRHKNRRFVLHA